MDGLEKTRAMQITLTPDEIRAGDEIARRIAPQFAVEPTNAEDAAYVREKTEQFGEPGPEARLLEAALVDCIANRGWLGPNAVVRTSKFDDFRHGVDAAVGIPGKDGKIDLAFNIDLTTNKDMLSKKLGRMKYGMSRSLGTLTYTGMESLGYAGEQTGVPQFLVSISPERVRRLIGSWVIAHRSGSQNLLETNASRWVTVAELHHQSRVYLDYAKQNDFRLAVEKYEKAHAVLTKLYEKIPDDVRADLERSPKIYDQMYENLLNALNGFSTLPEVNPALGKSNVQAMREEGARPTMQAQSGTVIQSQNRSNKVVEVVVKKRTFKFPDKK